MFKFLNSVANILFEEVIVGSFGLTNTIKCIGPQSLSPRFLYVGTSKTCAVVFILS